MVPAPTTQHCHFFFRFFCWFLGGRDVHYMEQQQQPTDDSVMTVIMFVRCVTAGIGMHSAATSKAGLALVAAAHEEQLNTSLQKNCCDIIGLSDTH